MPTNRSEDERLREQIEDIIFGDTPRQYFSDNMLAKPDAIMALISQKITEAKQAYHDEITDNENKVWLTQADLDRRIIEARIDEVERIFIGPTSALREEYINNRITELKKDIHDK